MNRYINNNKLIFKLSILLSIFTFVLPLNANFLTEENIEEQIEQDKNTDIDIKETNHIDNEELELRSKSCKRFCNLLVKQNLKAKSICANNLAVNNLTVTCDVTGLPATTSNGVIIYPKLGIESPDMINIRGTILATTDGSLTAARGIGYTVDSVTPISIIPGSGGFPTYFQYGFRVNYTVPTPFRTTPSISNGLVGSSNMIQTPISITPASGTTRFGLLGSIAYITNESNLGFDVTVYLILISDPMTPVLTLADLPDILAALSNFGFGFSFISEAPGF